MNDEQHQILHMVQDGTLTPEEAETLLATLSSVSPQAPATKAPAPDMKQFRRYWEIPFAVGVILMGISGLCVSSTSNILLQVCGWSGLITAMIITLLGWYSYSSPWIHVRIKEHDGHRFAISLPLPLSAFGWLFDLARPVVQRFADDDTTANFETAASLVLMFEDAPTDEPITVEVDEEDGDHIQVYIG
jgi:hypothetical protein